MKKTHLYLAIPAATMSGISLVVCLTQNTYLVQQIAGVAAVLFLTATLWCLNGLLFGRSA